MAVDRREDHPDRGDKFEKDIGLRNEIQGRPVPDGRIEMVDALRGFALSALFLVHMLESYELYWSNPVKSSVTDVVFLLFMGKSFSLLALCFGFSFYILMERAAARGVDFSKRFAWRLLVLELIGWAHALIYRGDIIQLLAAMGLLLLVAHRVKDNRWLIAAAIPCLINVPQLARLFAAAWGFEWASTTPHSWNDPAMQIYLSGDIWSTLQANLTIGQMPKWWFFIESGRLLQILGLYLIGLVLGRIGFFSRPQDFTKGRHIAFAIATTVALVFWWFRKPFLLWVPTLGYPVGVAWAAETLVGNIVELAGTAMWLLVVVGLWQGPLRRLLMPLVPLGRMTLTFYISQSLVFVPLFYAYGFGLHDDLSPAARLCIGLGALVVQMIIARVWLKHFRYGPIEWAWRAATYLDWNMPFRRKPA